MNPTPPSPTISTPVTPSTVKPVISIAQQFGEAIQVAPFDPMDATIIAASVKTVSLAVWFDSNLALVANAVKLFHAAGCKVIIKRHVDRSDHSNPYRLSYYRMPWFYAEFAARVRQGLALVLGPGDAIEIANEPAYAGGDVGANGNQLDYPDNTAVWRDLFASIALEDRQALPGVEIIGPLPQGQTPESTTAIMSGLNLSAADFAPFDSISAHMYPTVDQLGSPAQRLQQLVAFGKWAGKPIRVTECGCDARQGPTYVANYIAAVLAGAAGVESIDWWCWDAPEDGFSMCLKSNPAFVKAIAAPLATTAGPGTATTAGAT